MVLEPVTITIGGATLFWAIFSSGRAVYDQWDSARNFPMEMRRARAELTREWILFSRKANYRFCDLRNFVNPEDENHPNTRALLDYLRSMEELFKSCDQIIKTYYPAGIVEHMESSSNKTVPERRKSRSIFLRKLGSWKPKDQQKPTLDQSGSASLRSSAVGLSELTERDRVEDQALKHLGTFKRAGWALNGERLLQRKIRELARMNQGLTDLLEVKTPQNLSLLYPQSSGSYNADTMAELSWELKNLHETIRSINTASKSQGPFLLSVRIMTTEDETALRTELDERLGQPSQQGSRFHLVQRHSSAHLADPSTSLIVESTAERLYNSSLPSTALQSLHSSSENVPENGIVYWGHINGTSDVRTRHKVYHETDGYSSATTLSLLLDSQDYRNHITPRLLLRTATRLVTAYATFSQVRNVCKDPSVQDVRFYRASETEHSDWATGQSLIESPWLFSGFGGRKAKTGPIGSLQLQQTSQTSIFRLGLLLYQLAMGTVLKYPDNVDGVAQIRRQVLKSGGLRRVERLMGSTYTNLISSCFDFAGLEMLGTVEASHEAAQARIRWMLEQLRRCQQHAAEDDCLVFTNDSETISDDDVPSGHNTEAGNVIPEHDNRNQTPCSTVGPSTARPSIQSTSHNASSRSTLAESPRAGTQYKHR